MEYNRGMSVERAEGGGYVSKILTSELAQRINKHFGAEAEDGLSLLKIDQDPRYVNLMAQLSTREQKELNSGLWALRRVGYVTIGSMRDLLLDEQKARIVPNLGINRAWLLARAFTRTPEKAAERQERIKVICDAYEAGLRAPTGIGYHGTSLEAIQYLIEQGNLPTDELLPDFFFYPSRVRFRDHPLSASFRADEEVLKEAVRIAKGHGFTRRFQQLTGVELEGEEWYDFYDLTAGLDDLDWDWREDMELRRGFSYLGLHFRDVEDARRLAARRRGVIIVPGREALNLHTLDEDFFPDGEWSLMFVTPQGLSYRGIVGIKPLGPEEKEFFENLKREL